MVANHVALNHIQKSKRTEPHATLEELIRIRGIEKFQCRLN